MVAASCSGLRAVHLCPVSPITDQLSPVLLAQTGVPHAIASAIEFGNPSPNLSSLTPNRQRYKVPPHRVWFQVSEHYLEPLIS